MADAATQAEVARVGLPPRRSATRLIQAVLEKRRPFDTAFAEETRTGRLAGLAARDKALARAIAAMTLRRRGQIDAIFSSLLERPLKSDAGLVRSIARTAIAEILFMDAPDHAVVNLAVHQAQDDRYAQRFAGLLNAVLRRASREGPAMIAAQDAAALNTPEWLRASWVEAHGSGIAERLAAASMSEAPLDISVKEDAVGWATRLGGAALPGGTVRLDQGGRIEDMEGFDDGEWWVQDAAAALPARLLGDVAGKRVADLCAAPGGKTAQLASAGAQVTAVDISGNRLALLKDNMNRLGLHADIIESDAQGFAPHERFDAILLDAPCSATGTIRRHPDIPHLKSRSDIARLANLQERLLEKAAGLVKPGGTLIYCTCSLQREEGEAQIETLMEKGLPVSISPIGDHEAGGLSHSISDRGFLRTWPFSGEPGGTDAPADGFFVARLVAA